MRKVLVLGGTRFFGKSLVQKLMANGDHVSVATRGNTKLEFNGKVDHIKVNRFDRSSMEAAFKDGEWDVIYDQICYAPNDALDACEIFSEKVGKYVFTSSRSVYDNSGNEEKSEMDFDPYIYPLNWGRKEQFDYNEGKRLAEAVFFQKASFPVIAVRPPVVFGDGDYTERLHYYVRKVLKQEKIGLDKLDARVTFIESDDLAQFLFWVASQEFSGPINASSPDQISLGKMIKLIEKVTNKKAIVEPVNAHTDASPLNVPMSLYQNVSLAEAKGYQFKRLSVWMEPLIEFITEQEVNK